MESGTLVPVVRVWRSGAGSGMNGSGLGLDVVAGASVLVPGEDDVVVEDEPERGSQAEADDVGRDVVRQR